MIIDSPGVGESDEMDEMVIQYLPEAFAFIYVANSSIGGGVQKDRVSTRINVSPFRRFIQMLRVFIPSYYKKKRNNYSLVEKNWRPIPKEISIKTRGSWNLKKERKETTKQKYKTGFHSEGGFLRSKSIFGFK